MTKWVTKKLGEIASLQGGFAFQSKDFADDGIPLIRIGDITAKGLNINDSAKLPSCFLDKHTEFALKADDTIIAMSGATVGKCTLVTEKDIPALLNQRVGRFKVKNGIDKKFVYYTVSNYSYQQKLLLDAIGGAQPNVSPRQIESVPCSIPVNDDGTPDLAEQRRIAGILSSADGAIAASEALIAKYRNIKRGLLTTLLQPKEGWKKVKLGECCEVNPKTDLSALHSNDEIAFLKMEDVSNDGKITNCNYLKYCFLAKKGFTTFQNEDVIFAKITPCMENGKGALVRNIKSVVGMGSTEFHVLRAKENISIDFIYQISISKHFRLEAEMQMTGSAGQQRVPTAFLEEYEISVPYKNGQPDLAEQRRIAEILSSVDAKIAAEEKVVEKYKGVKKGLMEELLKSNL